MHTYQPRSTDHVRVDRPRSSRPPTPEHAGSVSESARPRPSIAITLPADIVDVIVAEVTKLVILEGTSARGASVDLPEFMSVDTAARYLDVSPERIRKLQARKKLPYYQESVGCRVLFRRTDLDEWMAKLRTDTHAHR